MEALAVAGRDADGRITCDLQAAEDAAFLHYEHLKTNFPTRVEKRVVGPGTNSSSETLPNNESTKQT